MMVIEIDRYSRKQYIDLAVDQERTALPDSWQIILPFRVTFRNFDSTKNETLFRADCIPINLILGDKKFIL
jgi:hypothetical protein